LRGSLPRPVGLLVLLRLRLIREQIPRLASQAAHSLAKVRKPHAAYFAGVEERLCVSLTPMGGGGELAGF
jgi:hypothetical protein